MKKVDIGDLSALACTYHFHRDECSNADVLVAGFAGVYGTGSAGNGDAAFIRAETLRGLAAFDPCALILDFRRLTYRWGNAMLGVFQAIDEYKNATGEPPFPIFVVTSDLCRDALLSLMGTTQEDAHWQFSDLDAALDAATAAGVEWLDA